MQEQHKKRPVLLVDSANLFIRAYYAYPQMSATHGQQMGGVVGFMKILRSICERTSPSEIVVAWESGGSARRRALFSDYKKGRRPDKPNRHYDQGDIPETDQNRVYQAAVLSKMLSCLPIKQTYVEDAEGDDAIAYMCRGRYSGVKKVIVSSDKDMFQLIDGDTSVYSLHKKTFVDEAALLEEFRVTSANFGIAKALCGDGSDNIAGVKGVGFKTLVRRFPFLGTDERQILLSDVFDYCSAHLDESRVYKHVLEQRELVERNWRLVHLDTSSLSAQQAASIDAVLDAPTPHPDKMSFIKHLIVEGINDFDADGLFYTLRCVELNGGTR